VQLEKPYPIQGSVFAHRATLGGSVAQMVREASKQAEAQYGVAPTICLLSGWDYQRFVKEHFFPEDAPDMIQGPALLNGVTQVIPVNSLFPGNCLVGWPEGEAPGQPRCARTGEALGC